MHEDKCECSSKTQPQSCLLGHFNIVNTVFVHINSHSNQLFLTAHLQKAHLKPFKSKAVTVSTVRYRHSDMAFHSMLRSLSRQGSTV